MRPFATLACLPLLATLCAATSNYSDAIIALIQTALDEANIPKAVDYRYCSTYPKRQIGGSCHQYADDFLLENQLCLARGGSPTVDRRAALDINDFWSCKNYGTLAKTTSSPYERGPDHTWWSALHGVYALGNDESAFLAAQKRAEKCKEVWNGAKGVHPNWLKERGLQECACSRSAAVMPGVPHDSGPGSGNRTGHELLLHPFSATAKGSSELRFAEAAKPWSENHTNDQPAQRYCYQSHRGNESMSWMNEVWLAKKLARYGPTRTMGHVVAIGQGNSRHPLAACVSKKMGNGHNYVVVGYNFTDVRNAYFIINASPRKKMDDDASMKKPNSGYGFIKMFTACGESMWQGTYGIADRSQFLSICPLRKDARGEYACDKSVDACVVDPHHTG